MHVPPATLATVCSLLLLAGCAVGPDYVRPTTAVPTAFGASGPWKTAAPRDTLPKGHWWVIYQDTGLNRLQTEAAAASPTLAIALARRDQARALSRFDRAGLFPTLALEPSAQRARVAPNVRTGAPATTGNTFSLPLDLTYELDLWGRVRRLAEAADARAEASEADYHAALLSLQAEVARLYFSWRTLDAEHALLARTSENRRESLAIVTRRLELGAGAELDVQLAQAELAAAESERLAIAQDRTSTHHALAVLVGKMPGELTLDDVVGSTLTPPAVPLGVPSELLERRLDIAAAERTLAAANAGIGAAKAAFFPSITLFGTAGFQSSSLSTLTDRDNHQWSFGPGVSLPIFQGGRNSAAYRRAQAAHAEALALYRQTVLTAFGEVETALADATALAARGTFQASAQLASQQAATLVRQRYEAGQLGYLDVTEAERTAILNERRLVQLHGQTLLASVTLIKALGGGW